jgi:tRNA(Ile2) C34 agmatinyltransferase TiaS
VLEVDLKELELLKSPILELVFAFELKFPFDALVCGYCGGVVNPKGNGSYVCTECARSTYISEGSSGAWNATKFKENQHKVP